MISIKELSSGDIELYFERDEFMSTFNPPTKSILSAPDGSILIGRIGKKRVHDIADMKKVVPIIRQRTLVKQR